MVVEKSAAQPKPEPIDIEEAIREVIFEPNEGPQTDFLASTEQEVLYGGSAGGGKSYAMIADPVRYLNNPNARMLLVRRSTEELRELISVSKQLYPKAIPGIKFTSEMLLRRASRKATNSSALVPIVHVSASENIASKTFSRVNRLASSRNSSVDAVAES